MFSALSHLLLTGSLLFSRGDRLSSDGAFRGVGPAPLWQRGVGEIFHISCFFNKYSIISLSLGGRACLPRPRSINSAGPGPVGRGGGEGERSVRKNHLAVVFTTSLGLKPLPCATFPIAASTPKSSETLMIPLSWPVVHPNEIFVAGWMISFPGS